MRLLGVTAVSLALLGCGSRGKARPAELELQWPDASIPAPKAPFDAGLDVSPVIPIADAQPSPEVPN